MAKLKVYISAPIHGYDLDERREYFRKAEYMLDMSGYEPFNPLAGVRTPISRAVCMRRDIRKLLNCDAIIMLGNWVASEGCKLEKAIAESIGLVVIQQCDFREDGKNPDKFSELHNMAISFHMEDIDMSEYKTWCEQKDHSALDSARRAVKETLMLRLKMLSVSHPYDGSQFNKGWHEAFKFAQAEVMNLDK